MTNFGALRSWRFTAYQALRVLWAGGLWSAGLLIVPALFQTLEREQAVAGAVAVFRVLGVVSFVLLAGLMVLHGQVKAAQSAFFALLLAMIAGFVLHFWIIPQLLASYVAAEKEPFWHISASVLFALQMLCSAWVALSVTTHQYGSSQ